jgi:hypothetical protein
MWSTKFQSGDKYHPKTAAVGRRKQDHRAQYGTWWDAIILQGRWTHDVTSLLFFPSLPSPDAGGILLLPWRAFDFCRSSQPRRLLSSSYLCRRQLQPRIAISFYLV